MNPPEITLRDYFAGLAMQGEVSNVWRAAELTEIAKKAYIQADAMMKAREQ